MMTKPLGTAFLVFALALAPALSAHAAEAPEGYLTAFVCESMPKQISVSSVIEDNTEENVRLYALLVDRLAKNQVTVKPSAGLTMSFEVTRVHEAAKRKPGDLVDVRVGEGEKDVGREGFAKVHMNIWSNAKDSVIGGRRESLESQPVDQLRIAVAINSKANGRCLWRGEVVQNLDGRDASRVADKLIPILADAVGTSVSQKPIVID